MTESLIRSAQRALPAVAVLALSTAVQAQVRPALVRNVDEPARVPYTQRMAPTCSFTNPCTATFPAVPAGKRLRVTSVQAMFFNDNFQAFLGVHTGTAGFSQPLSLVFPLAPISGFFYGVLLSTSQPVDLIYEAGDSPMLEVGCSVGNTFSTDSRNSLGISGYLVDTTP
jgi:hypothetical protein